MYKLDKEILEILAYNRLDEIIDKNELNHSQVYDFNEGEQVKLTNIGNQLFLFWYEHYQKIFDDFQRGKEFENKINN